MNLHSTLLFTSALFFLISSNVHAGCGDSQSVCYFYKGNKLISKSPCNITQCANVDGGLERWIAEKNGVELDFGEDGLKVNGKPGFSVKKGELSCYGLVSNKSELYCR